MTKLILSLRRGSSVLIGGVFERLFCPEGREFEQANLESSNCLGVASGIAIFGAL